jgi:hypothetical protein
MPQDAEKVSVHMVETDQKPGQLTVTSSHKSYLKDLIAIANNLDKKGLLSEADHLDAIIKKLQTPRR